MEELQDIRDCLTDIWFASTTKAEIARAKGCISTMEYFLGRKAGLKIAIDMIDKILKNK